MRRRHLRGVMAIERQVYSAPVEPEPVRRRDDASPTTAATSSPASTATVVGYAGMICYGDEAHVTNIAVDPAAPASQDRDAAVPRAHARARSRWARGRSRSRSASRTGARSACTAGTGSGPSAIRKNYYQELNEDALIMWADDVRTPAYARAARAHRGQELPEGVRPCGAPDDHPRHRDLLRRDRRRGRRGRVHGPLEPDRRAGASARAVRRGRARGRGRARTWRPSTRCSSRRSPRPALGSPTSTRSPCTVGPGLVGALLVGMAAAKAVALATGARFVGVNHLEGHIWANFLGARAARAAVRVPGRERRPHDARAHAGGRTATSSSGQTLDDAAGEAFDKVARLLGLGFPGGPALDRLAREGDPAAVRFPRAMADSGDLDFSMSGLKTAVLRHVKRERAAGRAIPAADLAASFQEAIVDVQVAKTIRAATERGVRHGAAGRRRGGQHPPARADDVRRRGGGPPRPVSAPRALCTDNAAMIACVGAARAARGEATSLDIGADPNLRLTA